MPPIQRVHRPSLTITLCLIVGLAHAMLPGEPDADYRLTESGLLIETPKKPIEVIHVRRLGIRIASPPDSKDGYQTWWKEDKRWKTVTLKRTHGQTDQAGKLLISLPSLKVPGFELREPGATLREGDFYVVTTGPCYCEAYFYVWHGQCIRFDDRRLIETIKPITHQIGPLRWVWHLDPKTLD